MLSKPNHYHSTQHVESRNVTLLVIVACLCGPGKVDAFIRLELDPSELVECEDPRGRDIFLYPDRDLYIRPHMKVQFGDTSQPAYSQESWWSWCSIV